MDVNLPVGARTPGRRVIALGILVFAILAVAIVLKADDTPNNEYVPSEELRAERSDVTEPDTDGDGLKDWEEALLGTNPRLSDSDGDGIGDGAERSAELERTMEERQAIAETLDPRNDEDWGTLSYSEQVSRLLLSGYLTHKEPGGVFSSNDTVEIIRSLPEFSGDLPDAVVYTEADISISNDSSDAALHAYGNAVGALLAVPEGETPTNELLALLAYFQTGDRESFSTEIGAAARTHETLVSGLRFVTVPRSLADTHLELMNALSAVAYDLRLFTYIATEPLLAVTAISAYNEDTTRRGDAFAAMRSAFDDAGVSFDESESGYLLVVVPPTP